MDDTTQNGLFTRESERENVVSGRNDERRIIGTRSRRLSGKRARSVRGYGLRRGATSRQSSTDGIENRNEKEVRRVHQTSDKRVREKTQVGKGRKL